MRRVEDPVLITGKGCYVDDIQLPGMLHMAFLRSPYPHAKILSIQTSAAQAMPGVVAVVTGDDLSERLHVPVMPLVPGMKIPPHPLLARGAVHAAGVPVAAVVAHSRALAQDAANAIAVEYAALPAVVNAEKALEPGAPLAREELDSNICYTTTKTRRRRGQGVRRGRAYRAPAHRQPAAGGARAGAARRPGEAGANGGSHGVALDPESAPSCALISPPPSAFLSIASA